MPASVDQADAETILSLETQIYTLQQMKNKKCEEVMARLMDGSAIEPGAHRFELREQSRGPRRTYHLAIDGRLIRGLVLLVAFAWYSQAADDPAGWTSAKWGMSPGQVQAAVPAAAAIPPEKFVAGATATLGIPALQLGPTTWSVFLLFGPTGLDRVMLRPADRADVSQAEYLRLENLLAQKYGRPFERRIYKEGIASAQWSFATTTVSLQLTDYRPRVQLVTLWLEYARKSPDTDKL